MDIIVHIVYFTAFNMLEFLTD